MTQTFKLREAFGLPAEPKIDVEKGILYGVKVLGLISQNGKRYTKAAIKGAIPLLENSRSYFDHPEGDSNNRKFSDRFARLREVKQDDKGEAYCNLHFNPHHERAASFIWYAQNDPAGIGLSINGEGKGSIHDGVKLVEQITKIHSVDIVDGPATVAGLFEQQDYEPPPAAAPATGGGEMDGEADSGADFRAKLADLAQHVVSDASMSKEDILAKLKKIVHMIEDEAPEAAEGEEAPTDEKAIEQLAVMSHPAVKWAHGKLAAVKLVEKKTQLREQAVAAGLAEKAITDTFIDTLLRESTEAGVVALIEDRKSVVPNGPKYTPRVNPTNPAAPKTPAQLADHYFGGNDIGEAGA